jgi:enamine deaminase RidA (YjgF/YER057c/UK114 family)
MNRTPVNPWRWAVPYGFNQAELIEGPSRTLVCSGQAAVDADGRPQHPGDMAAQIDLTISNLEALVAEADMTLANVVHLTIYTTGVDAILHHLDPLSKRLVDVGGVASTLLGVTRLTFPDLLVEIEATVID